MATKTRLGLLHAQMLNTMAQAVSENSSPTHHQELDTVAESMGLSLDKDELAEQLAALLHWAYTQRVFAATALVERYGENKRDLAPGILRLADKELL